MKLRRALSEISILIIFLMTLSGIGLSQESPVVEVTTEQQRLTGIKTYKVTVQPLIKTIKAPGIISFDETLTSTINTKIEGWIERLYANTTGRYVNKGEPLAEIYSPELLSTQEELLTALRLLKEAEERGSEPLIRDAEKLYEAARQRLLRWDISEEEIKKIEASGSAFRTLTIRSPHRGYVVQKYIVEGSRLMPGEKLFDIADLERVWIIAEINESHSAILQGIKEAEIRLGYLPSRAFRAKPDYIYPQLSEQTRTLKVRFVIPNKDLSLRPGMFTEVSIKINLGRRPVIPEDAVIETGLRSIVYVQKTDEEFEPREVLLGVSADGMREVIKGLRPGERVVSHGTFLIDSEAKLKGIKPLPLR